ncbi:nuclear transport factor 2 family protein [Streptomyces rubiginosohelvolus]
MLFPAMPSAVDRFYRASQESDATSWAEAFAEAGVFHDPWGTEPIVGREAIRLFIASVLAGFRSFGLTPLDAYTVGGRVAASWRGSAVALDGATVNWSGINVYELDADGLIKQATAYFDRAVFQAQLTPRHLPSGN